MLFLFTRTDLEAAGSVGAGWTMYRKLQLSLEIVLKEFCGLGDRMEVLMQSYMLHMKGFNVLLVEIFVIQDIFIYVLIMAQQLIFLLIIQIELKEHSRQQMLGIH
jgi:hypothetical protein